VGEAAFWGFIGASALIIGAIVPFLWTVGIRPLGLIMAFGSGVLLSAVAYELVLESYSRSGTEVMAAGMAVGAVTFFFGDRLISGNPPPPGAGGAGGESEGSPISIVLGALLDGIPESFILGFGLVGGEGVTVAYLVAVFMSNLPESIAASVGLKEAGWTRNKLLLLWTGIALASTLAAALGYLVFDSMENLNGAFVLAFAGGAVLTMLANTMIPESYEYGGKSVGLAAVFGFTLALVITTLQ
jgi:ZIP family zinc transporter